MLAACASVEAPSGSADPRFVGRWTDTGDCHDVVEMFADGTFRTRDGRIGRWEVSGDVMTFSGSGGTVRLRLDSVDADRIVSTNEEGETGTSTRC